MNRLTIAFASVFACAAFAQSPRPERVVESNAVISAREPRLHIQVPKAARYLGADRWNLYGVADCEIHVFVEAARNRQMQRVYWIQFEGYLPHLPNNTYDYSSNELRRIDGLDFRIRARFGPTGEPSKPGSDGERVWQMVEKAGYSLPSHMMNVRLVHLIDDTRRRELMVIYAEDLAPTGYTSDELRVGDEAAPQWRELEKKLIERATKRIRFSR